MSGPKVLGLLPEFGLRVDSSVVPLTRRARATIFWPRPTRSSLDALTLLEVPLTMVPVVAGTPGVLARLAPALARRLGPPPAELVPIRGAPPGCSRPGFPWPPCAWRPACTAAGAAGCSPCSSTLRSSSPGPAGSSPPSRRSAAFVAKIRAFLTWLVKTGPVEGVTLSGLYQEYGISKKGGSRIAPTNNFKVETANSNSKLETQIRRSPGPPPGVRHNRRPGADPGPGARRCGTGPSPASAGKISPRSPRLPGRI